MSDFATAEAQLATPALTDAAYEPRLFAFSGRLGRVRYLVYGTIVPFIIAMLLGATVAIGTAAGGLGLLTFLLILPGSIAMVVSAIVFARRRLNDLDQSGWMYLITFVPFVNMALAIWMVFAPGTAGPNRFGAPPSPNSRAVVTVAWVLGALMLVAIVAAFMIPALSMTRAIPTSVSSF
jgi:uncharacterized membrane protein YhaH (DUF805 family)